MFAPYLNIFGLARTCFIVIAAAIIEGLPGLSLESMILSGFVLSNLETMLRYCQNHTTKKKGGLKTILSGDVATLA